MNEVGSGTNLKLPEINLLAVFCYKLEVISLFLIVTNKFPDGNFSRPRLAVFAFASQNKNIAAPWLN